MLINGYIDIVIVRITPTNLKRLCNVYAFTLYWKIRIETIKWFLKITDSFLTK